MINNVTSFKNNSNNTYKTNTNNQYDNSKLVNKNVSPVKNKSNINNSLNKLGQGFLFTGAGIGIGAVAGFLIGVFSEDSFIDGSEISHIENKSFIPKCRKIGTCLGALTGFLFVATALINGEDKGKKKISDYLYCLPIATFGAAIGATNALSLGRGSCPGQKLDTKVNKKVNQICKKDESFGNKYSELYDKILKEEYNKFDNKAAKIGGVVGAGLALSLALACYCGNKKEKNQSNKKVFNG